MATTNWVQLGSFCWINVFHSAVFRLVSCWWCAVAFSTPASVRALYVFYAQNRLFFDQQKMQQKPEGMYFNFIYNIRSFIYYSYSITTAKYDTFFMSFVNVLSRKEGCICLWSAMVSKKYVKIVGRSNNKTVYIWFICKNAQDSIRQTECVPHAVLGRASCV